MLRKIRSLVSNSDYFGIYDNDLSKKECEIIINQFEKSEHHPGLIWFDGMRQEVPDYKKCITLQDTTFDDGSVITNIVRPQLTKCLQRYNFEQPQLIDLGYWNLDNEYVVQKYETEEDGYKDWHCEHGLGGEGRIMAWMFYLNNAKSGTEFRNYPTVGAKMGRCAIWPSGWTHVHRGGTPNKGIKYIVTGWISYLE